MPKVKIYVSGRKFEIERKLIDKDVHTKSRLFEICSEAESRGEPLVFHVDRPAESFAAVLSFYQTGELHMPLGVCPRAFEIELRYWKVETTSLATCCSVRYASFFEGQETLNHFKASELADEELYKVKTAATTLPAVTKTRTRTRLWNIVDNREPSTAAKIYFAAVLLMVTMSIFVTALSTESLFHRRLTKCELVEYIEHTNSEEESETEASRLVLGFDDCTGQSDDDFYRHLKEFDDHFRFYIPDDNETATDDVPKAETIIKNGSDVNNTTSRHDERFIKIPKKTVPWKGFEYFEYTMLTFFTIDIILRLFCCPSLKRYFLSVINVLDCTALIGSYVSIIINNIEKEEKYQITSLDLLKYVQILRSFRLIRVVRNITACKVLSYSLRDSFRDLTVLVMFLIIGIVTFSNFIYFTETRDTFPSIPIAWWWALVTMTTVGYGDYAPKSTIGRIIGSLCAISGLLLLSVTVPIFVNNFLLIYQYAVTQRKIHLRAKMNKAKKKESKVHVYTLNLPSPPTSFMDKPITTDFKSNMTGRT